MSEVIVIKNNFPLAKEALDRAVKQGLTKIAMTLEAAMKYKITSNIPPPLKPETIKRKGSSVALIDTGLMRSQISSDFGHLDNNTVSIGVFGNRAEIAAYHEFGAPGANIPERSFLRSSLEDVKPQIPRIISDELKKEFSAL